MFMIPNMPEGKHEIRLWHGTGYYLHRKIKSAKGPGYEITTTKDPKTARKKTLMLVTVESGKVLDMKQIKLKADWFENSDAQK